MSVKNDASFKTFQDFSRLFEFRVQLTRPNKIKKKYFPMNPMGSRDPSEPISSVRNSYSIQKWRHISTQFYRVTFDSVKTETEN